MFTFLVTTDLQGAESIPIYWELLSLQDVGQLVLIAGLEPRIHGSLRQPYLVNLPGKTEKAEKERNRVEPLEEAKRKGYLTTEGGREDRRARGMNHASLQLSQFLTWSIVKSRGNDAFGLHNVIFHLLSHFCLLLSLKDTGHESAEMSQRARKTLKGNMRQAQQGKVWDLEYAAVLCSLCKQRLGMEMGESQAPL